MSQQNPSSHQLYLYDHVQAGDLFHVKSIVKNPELWTWYKPYPEQEVYYPWKVLDTVPRTRVIDEARGFELSPMYFSEGDQPEAVETDEEANMFSVYKRSRQKDGSILSLHLADFTERQYAEIFVEAVFTSSPNSTAKELGKMYEKILPAELRHKDEHYYHALSVELAMRFEQWKTDNMWFQNLQENYVRYLGAGKTEIKTLKQIYSIFMKQITEVKLPESTLDLYVKPEKGRFLVYDQFSVLLYSSDVQDRAEGFKRELSRCLTQYNHYLMHQTSLSPVSPHTFLNRCQKTQFKSSWAPTLIPFL